MTNPFRHPQQFDTGYISAAIGMIDLAFLDASVGYSQRVFDRWEIVVKRCPRLQPIFQQVQGACQLRSMGRVATEVEYLEAALADAQALLEALNENQ